jgi:hypothetical protein
MMFCKTVGALPESVTAPTDGAISLGTVGAYPAKVKAPEGGVTNPVNEETVTVGAVLAIDTVASTCSP